VEEQGIKSNLNSQALHSEVPFFQENLVGELGKHYMVHFATTPYNEGALSQAMKKGFNNQVKSF